MVLGLMAHFAQMSTVPSCRVHREKRVTFQKLELTQFITQPTVASQKSLARARQRATIVTSLRTDRAHLEGRVLQCAQHDHQVCHQLHHQNHHHHHHRHKFITRATSSMALAFQPQRVTRQTKPVATIYASNHPHSLLLRVFASLMLYQSRIEWML